MTLEEWLSRYESRLGSCYEKLFVVQVLSSIPDLDLAAVQPQFSFSDADGRQRYCDFVLMEGSDVRIAIEIDGYDKRGTGSGMTRADFLDWQRRQAALTAQGWFVLRFANTDVRDHPQRCQKHIQLLLRRERRRQQHLAQLTLSVRDLKTQLQQLHGTDQEAELAQKQRLETELRTLNQQLKYAKEAKPLDAREQQRLEELQQAAQQQIDLLKGDNTVMKTTIWAFTTLLAVLLVTFALKFGGGPVASSVPPGPQQERFAGSKGSSCDNPEAWHNAARYVDKYVALSGPVKRITHRPDINGQPTWIEIGASFPDDSRVTLVIWGDHRDRFGSTVLQSLAGKIVCVMGTVTTYKSLPQVQLTDPLQLVLL